ncbi:thiamine ABC transporter substrate-binding protein [Escherichia coli]|nr:thiamine ABC transporter substrate-binding protein [Escherichia coli]
MALEDGVSLLNRLRMEGKNSKADVVLGLDNNLLDAASKTGLFAKSGVAADAVNVPGGWNNDTFVPFDYGYFAFVYDKNKLKNPPQSLKELVESDQNWRVIYQDPRTSTPGLGLLLWMQKSMAMTPHKPGRNWRRKRSRSPKAGRSLRPVFKGESDLVLSYTTSPAYHILEEKKITTPPRTLAKVTICRWKSPPAPLPASSRSWRKIPPVYGFSGFSECDPNRQLDVSGGKRHAACRF